MKKIIAAIDGLKYSESTTEYAVQMAKEMDAHLVGVMLEDYTYHSFRIVELLGTEGVLESEIRRFEEKDAQTRKDAADTFELSCRAAGINYSIHHDKNIALYELLHESIYADLLIIDRKETLTHYEETIPTRFMRDLLSEVQCPVLLVPPHYEPIEKVVLLFDGEPTSVFAIRHFSYLLPSMKNLDVEVLTVKRKKDSLHLPDNRLMKEFMKRHFPNASYNVLKGTPDTEIVNYLQGQGLRSLVVLGAYNRGMVSRWFRESMADVLMKELELPLFIAHN